MTTDANEFLTTSEAARRLRRSESTVRSLADRGRLPVYRLSTGIRVFAADAVERLRAEIAAADAIEERR